MQGGKNEIEETLRYEVLTNRKLVSKLLTEIKTTERVDLERRIT